MTRQPRRSVAITACLLVLGCFSAVTIGPAAHAAGPSATPSPTVSPTTTTTYTLKDSDFALTVSPTRIVLRPDDLGTKQEIQVVNQGQKPVTVNAQKRSFIAGASGSLKYQATAPYSASRWVTIAPTAFVIAPGATQVVTATVVVPKAPDAGDHQVAIVFLVPATQTAANVKINRGISIPMFVTVPGPTSDTTALSDLSAPGFATGGPVQVTASLRNTGTVHRDFRAAEPLTMSAGGSTSAFADFTVMRGAVRDVATTWDPPFLCVCHPSVSFRNADGTVESASIRVVVFPWPVFAGAAVVALILIFGFRWWHGRQSPATPAGVDSAAGAPPPDTALPDPGDRDA